MVKVGSLFTQVLSLINRNDFARAVGQWDAERSAKGFRCWDQFVANPCFLTPPSKLIVQIGVKPRCCGQNLDEDPKRQHPDSIGPASAVYPAEVTK